MWQVYLYALLMVYVQLMKESILVELQEFDNGDSMLNSNELAEVAKYKP